MSAMKCSKCGGQTNSAVCDWRLKDKVVVECYAKVENGVWVRGCGYANCDLYTVEGVDALLGKSVIPSNTQISGGTPSAESDCSAIESKGEKA